MAVRHLKRYASWVQTVQHLIERWEIERFEPTRQLLATWRRSVRIDKLTAVAYGNMRVSKSTDIGGTRNATGNTDEKIQFESVARD